jgi:hypothetical protein
MPNRDDSRASVVIVSQIGFETTPGVGGSANRFLPTISFLPKLKRETKQFRAQGSKYNTSSVRHKQSSDGTFDGVLDYNSLPYLLQCLTVPVTTPSGPLSGTTTAYRYQYNPLSRQLDNPKTLVCEVGDASKVDLYRYTQPTSLTIAWGQDDLKISGNLIARTMVPNQTQTGTLNEITKLLKTGTVTGGHFHLTYSAQQTADIPYNATADDVQGYLEALNNIAIGDVQVYGGPLPSVAMYIEWTGTKAGTDITVTIDNTGITGGGSIELTTQQAGGGAGITEIPERPVERGQINVHYHTDYAALLAAVDAEQETYLITDAFEEQMALGEKFKPKFVHNRNFASFKEAIEVAPSLTFSFMTEHNSQSQAILQSAIDADVMGYLCIDAVGVDLGSSPTGARDESERITFYLGGKFTDPEEVKDAMNAGVYAYRYNFVALQNAAMGRPWLADIVNSRASW